MTSTTITVASGEYVFAASDVTLTNASTISGTVAVSSTFSDDTLINRGLVSASGVAVSMAAGGSIKNAFVGVITGNAGAYVSGGTGTVTNYGSILGVSGNGVALLAGGGITNAYGLIEGYNGVGVASAAGTVSNASTIIGTGRQGVGLGAGGSIGNSGLISGIEGVYIGGAAGSVTNTGTILGSSSYGILLRDGGIVTNSAGLIEGSSGVTIVGTAGTIINNATIVADGSPHAGAGLPLGGTIINSGFITGITAAYIFNAGTIINSGTLAGAFGGAVFFLAGYAGDRLIVDPGAIFIGHVNGGNAPGSGFYSVLELASGASTGTLNGLGGSVYNFAHMQVDVGATWVFGSSAPFTGTLSNAGTIEGSIGGGAGTIALAAGYADRLVVEPGATFAAVVDGGNTIGSTVASTLEFASGASTGTLSGLGSQFIDFAQMTLDAGATWALNGAAAGVTMSNAGTLTNGVGVGTNSMLINLATGFITASTGAAVAASHADYVLNQGRITGGTAAHQFGVSMAGAGNVTNQSGGTISGYQAIYDQGSVATVINRGVVNGGTGSSGAGIYLANGGVVSNASSATISGAIGLFSDGGAVSNTGTIYGVSQAVELYNGGSLDNTGLIFGTTTGAVIKLRAGTITNTGQLYGSLGDGVTLYAGGTVTNTGGMIGGSGGVGIAGAAGTVSNSGTISGIPDTIGVLGQGVALGDGGSIGNSGLINGFYGGVYVDGAAGTVSNTGTIVGEFRYGVKLHDGGVVTNGAGLINGGVTITSGTVGVTGTVNNASTIIGTVLLAQGGSVGNTGLIQGGVQISPYFSNAATLTNSGTILGGVGLNKGGTVNNSAGLIEGSEGVGIAGFVGSSGVVSNAATIIGTASDGVAMTHGGTLINTGLIQGVTHGAFISLAPGTLENAGTISAASDAVLLGSGFNDLLIADPGAVFVGTVDGGNTIGSTLVSTLELGSGASVGTLSGIGSQFIDFASIQLGAGATWKVKGGVPSGETIAFSSGADLQFANPGNVLGSVSNFGAGETIDLVGVDPASVGFASGTLSFAGGSFALALNGVSGVTAIASADGAAVVACFREGTRIATMRGDVPVEELAVGDCVRVVPHSSPYPLLSPTSLARGEGKICGAPVVWIGRRRIDCARHPAAVDVWPVRIAAGAFGRGRPTRDLWLSPDHAVFVSGVLIPVKHLINGTTIAQVMVSEVTYYHVELPRHNVMLAEGLAVESYLDTGDREIFVNNDGPTTLHPDMASRVWEAEGCAPLVVAGPVLAAVRRRLEQRAAA
jgi:Hint domain